MTTDEHLELARARTSALVVDLAALAAEVFESTPANLEAVAHLASAVLFDLALAS